MLHDTREEDSRILAAAPIPLPVQKCTRINDFDFTGDLNYEKKTDSFNDFGRLWIKR